MLENKKYIKIAYKEALKAYKKGDIPVGCVIVKNDKVIAKAYNKKEKNKIATYHAEILAINKACKKLKTWHLDDCILYSTMEPCIMCSGAIIQSRIKKIYYSVSNKNFGNIENNKIFKNNKYEIKKIENKQIFYLIQKFFQNIR
ncbi:MAG: nucleoside deaminase [Bacilli bacterium]|nr:nucleoside deaminase [Bacilli bacterium]